jgi:hypothetical protein
VFQSRVIFKIRTISTACPHKSLTGGLLRSRAVVRTSATSPVFAEPLNELVAVSVLYEGPYQSLITPLPAEIHRQFVEVYEEGVMNEGNICKWCRVFNGSRTDVHSGARSGCPSVIAENLKHKTDIPPTSLWPLRGNIPISHSHACMEGTRGSVVVKALCYKPESRGFDTQ